jgi:lysozyme
VNARDLFDAIRDIKGEGLTQAEVNRINRILAGTVESAFNGMRTSQQGIDLIHSFESLSLTAYQDPGSKNGLPITIGWGSTTDEEGRPIHRNAVWTKERADAKFLQDLRKVEVGVNTLLAGKPTTQHQFDALVSFAYNVGLDIDEDTKAEGLGDSTLLRKHLAGDYAGAQAQFASWIYNDGKKLAGLVRRRKSEAAMYGDNT